MTKWLGRVYINPKENISLGSNRNKKIEIKALAYLYLPVFSPVNTFLQSLYCLNDGLV